jgi:Cu-processing system ATP-binding protein
MIEFVQVSKHFGARAVLRDVTLNAAPGQITAIVGPNAAGKSTLIKMLLGLVRPDSGRIRVHDVWLNGSSDYRSEIGYMPQRSCFPENLTGVQVLSLLRDLRGTAAAVDEALVDEFGIRGELDKPIRTLSGGTRQKLNAVTAFLFRPRVLVLDEPTAGLDPVSSSLLKDRILEQRAAGVTFILTSHNMADLQELADSIVFVLEGAVSFAGTPAELLAQTGEATIERAFAALMTAHPVEQRV